MDKSRKERAGEEQTAFLSGKRGGSCLTVLWCYGETGYKLSSSGGRSVFFAMLHSLQQGTRLPLVERPPLDRGMIWSIVSSLTGNLC